MTREQIENRIKSAIPPCSEVGHVLAALDSLGVEHSDYDASTRTIYAIIRETAKSFLVEEAVQMRFIFDNERRLDRMEFEEVATGL